MNRFVIESGVLRDTQAGLGVMDDTQRTRDGYAEFVVNAHGRVLVYGLGLGVCIRMIQDITAVTETVVVEKHQEIIDLVADDAGFNGKVTVVHGDMWGHEPDGLWDTVLADIWSDPGDIYNASLVASGLAHVAQYAAAENAWIGKWAPP